jgi:trk system potassium uptake protein TrkH
MAEAGRLEPLSYAVRWRVVLKYLGLLAVALALLTAIPVAVALAYDDLLYAGRMAAAAAILAATGLPLSRLAASARIQANEAMVIIALTFVVASVAMALPMMGLGLAFPDALFEAVSGVTTTGLTTLASVEHMPQGFLFTRAWMQWYGGLGIVVFSLVLLMFEPGTAAKRLAGTEAEEEDLVGGTRAYAQRVLAVYLVLTAAGVAALVLSGVGPFDALLHILSAVSTGGFSTHDRSIAAVGPWGTQAVLTAFATAGAVSLALYYRATLSGWRALLASPELRALLLAGLATSALLALFMTAKGQWTGQQALQQAPLLALSAQSTTGFSIFPVTGLDAASRVVLIVSMLIGGNVGSTAGGIKTLRFLIVLRLMQLLVRRTRMPPHAVVEPRLGGDRLEHREIERAFLVVLMFISVIVLSWLPFVAMGYDPLNALFEVVSATATVGLSTGISSAGLDPWLKGVLCIDMLLGRLEILAVLVVLYPGTWLGLRRNADQ